MRCVVTRQGTAIVPAHAALTSTLSAERVDIMAMAASVAVCRMPRWAERDMVATHSMAHGRRTSSYRISCFTWGRERQVVSAGRTQTGRLFGNGRAV